MNVSMCGRGLFVAVMLCLGVSSAAAQDESREREGARPKPESPLRLTVPTVRHGHFDLISVDLEGREVRRLVRDEGGAFDPHWSPDGRRLLFVSFRENHIGHIFVYEAQSREIAQLTNTTTYERLPAFSPDGKCIAFTSSRSGNHDVFAMNADGTEPVNLSNNPGFDADPCWSPDGKKIVFASMRDGQPFRLFEMQHDGTGQKMLLSQDLSGWVYPHWSEQADAIVFGSPRKGGGIAISVLDPETKDVSTLTTEGEVNSYARISPDGRYVAYVRLTHERASAGGEKLDPKSAGGDLMLFDVEAGEHRRLSQGDVPLWGPRPAWEPLEPADAAAK